MISISVNKICIEGYCLARPIAIYAIIPLFLILLALVWATFVKFKGKEEKDIFVKEHRFDRVIFLILRSLVLILLLIAIASPYTIKETQTEGNPSLTILADNSSSFEIFDTTIAPKLKEGLEKFFPVTLKYIASGERSAIGDGILQNSEGDDNILVVSDGYNNYGRDLGDIILFSSILNTTIHTVKLTPLKKDVSITIDGPSQVIEMSENAFMVNVNNIGDVQYSSLEVFVDGDPVNIDSQGRFTWRFQRGYHKITARINFPKDDYFLQNNIYYKSVKSLPRPKLLLVAEKTGPLQQALEKVYDIETNENIPEKLDGYDAVLLNNLNIDKIPKDKVDLLTDYLGEDGKGLVVVGGENSFDKGNYKGSYFESILPAQVGIGKKTTGGNVNVVLVIDISESTGFGFSEESSNKKIDVEKALAINILNDIALDDNVGAVAFNHLGHVVWMLDKLSASLDRLPQKIASLKDTGGTLVSAGLYKAIGLLDKAQGSKNIIVISDGITQQPEDALNMARGASARGIRIYTVGVGETTNEQFMQSLALAGGGLYFKPTESQRLKVLFGEPEELNEDTMNLVIVDINHWITKGDLDLKAKLSGYNFVVPRSSGRKLVATDLDRPIIIIGRYGIGRIAVLATDDGSKWSGELFSKENSKIITRMVNWAIGDFTKDAEFDVRIEDVTLGKAADVNVISNEKPQEKGFEFVKLDAGLYSAKFRPEKEGFEQILGATVAVNYNDEYEKIGINPMLEELVRASGGYIFDSNDIEKIKDTIIRMSRRVKVETVNYSWPFAIAALILFLIDILIRRIRENRGITKF